ncbi:hypothetical protein [Avibacterium paragallinarum]|uniref:Mu-like prophage FluMu N-terminal domain-containing protein n=1 Tax=Avibacterium paragallinarum TaxID=728 RepID=A0ABU7QN21_AVIPA|nr:hypothetical protein [Avibacterium paragallinarum]QZP15574.1 hypothetical protein K5O18_12640 [Avibacterium paragallinarum]QZP16170.1 hypothetical protein K5O18_02060 [Avibacterium paragallinarum]WAL56470.1 hypothetical protein OY678_11020 [Avibacterium paragallinarum]WAM58999.1 hypothetical protein OW731_10795 [Avibacterium paragallinarum]
MARKSNTAKEKKDAQNASSEANLSADHSAEVKDEALKNADETDRTLEEGATAEAGDEALKNTAETNCTLEDDKVVEGGQVINPIAYAIKLRAIHPHDSYGRCGYRFYKDKETEIPANDLTGEQVLTLAEDPWLELVPVCEE